MKVSDTVSLTEILEEIKSRTYRTHYPVPRCEPAKGLCRCLGCHKMRLEMELEVAQRQAEITCPNFQHRFYCEKHARFVHFWEWCPECVNDKNSFLTTPHGDPIVRACDTCSQHPCACRRSKGGFTIHAG